MISSDPILPPALTELPQTLSLQDVLRHLGLHHAAANLDAASGKAIARNDAPLAILDHLMREELRVQTERKTQSALKRSALFPLTTIESRKQYYAQAIPERWLTIFTHDDATPWGYIEKGDRGKLKLDSSK